MSYILDELIHGLQIDAIFTRYRNNLVKHYNEALDLRLQRDAFRVALSGEIKEPENKRYLYGIDTDDTNDEWRYKISNYFKTQEEAESYRDYLEAEATLREDGGWYKFRPGKDNWYLYLVDDKLWPAHVFRDNYGSIYFPSEESIMESRRKHYNEWLTYLTYWSEK